MGRWSYLAVLGFILAGTAWLEIALRTRVFRRWRRLIATLFPVVFIFIAWDAYAVNVGHWWFDQARIVGIWMPARVPMEEFLFFFVVPIASILTLEAVRSATGLPVGDETMARIAEEPA